MNYNRNIFALPAGELVEELSSFYTGAILGRAELELLPSVFLWGPPGVGKSDAVREIAEQVQERTGKHVCVTDIRLLLFSPVDLRGIPTADAQRRFTEWLRPKLFDLDSSPETFNILFLDELSAAVPSVQAAAYQITLNHTIGEHRLPENTVVIAAGNRVTDKSVAYRMPNALANRLMHFEVSVEFESWRIWAVNHGINQYVLGYLTYDRSKLYESAEGSDDVAFPTPRSWNFVSRILNTMKDRTPEQLYHLIGGCIGTGVAMEFVNWCRSWRDIAPVEDIFAGKQVPYPQTPDALHAMISAMTAYAADQKEQMTIDSLGSCCRYASRFPGDFRSVLYLNLLAVRDLKLKLLKVPEFLRWMQENRQYLKDGTGETDV